MRFSQPKFWFKKNSILGKFLYPISKVYLFFFLFSRILKSERTISIPVICVGNIVLGGSGKTPIVIYLRKILNKKFKKIFVLIRGYRRIGKKNLLVSKKTKLKEVGDEALIHYSNGPVCVSSDRIKGANQCIKNKADLIILDDGFQSKHIFKNLSFIVIDNNQRFGNKKIFPAGPLRESLTSALARTDAIILVDSKNRDTSFIGSSNIPCFFAYKKIDIINLNSRNIIAFCGLGFPDSFFNHLTALGLVIKEKFIFRDHHYYTDEEIRDMIRISKKKKIDLVTTEKDIVKIPKKFHCNIKVAKLDIEIESEEKFLKFIFRFLAQ